MSYAAVPAPAVRPVTARGGAACLAIALLNLAGVTDAAAQMVPPQEHALRQATSGEVTTVRIAWGNAPHDDSREGLPGVAGRSLWRHWEGRIGVAIDRPLNPLKDSFVLAQPIATGLRVRSLHILSDYYVEGGFRATAGLVRGDHGQAWWGSGEHGGGLNISLQRLDNLGLLGTDTRQLDDRARQISPYFGAGYSSRTQNPGAASSWHFNADLGVIAAGASHLGDLLQGDLGAAPLTRDWRLSPVVKVAVGYAF